MTIQPSPVTKLLSERKLALKMRNKALKSSLISVVITQDYLTEIEAKIQLIIPNYRLVELPSLIDQPIKLNKIVEERAINNFKGKLIKAK